MSTVQRAKGRKKYKAGMICIRPAATLLEVSRLMAPEFLVEIEVEAIVAA